MNGAFHLRRFSFLYLSLAYIEWCFPSTPIQFLVPISGLHINGAFHLHRFSFLYLFLAYISMVLSIYADLVSGTYFWLTYQWCFPSTPIQFLVPISGLHINGAFHLHRFSFLYLFLAYISMVLSIYADSVSCTYFWLTYQWCFPSTPIQFLVPISGLHMNGAFHLHRFSFWYLFLAYI